MLSSCSIYRPVPDQSIESHLYALQDLACRLSSISNPHVIVERAVEWAAGLGFGSAVMHLQPEGETFRLEAAAGFLQHVLDRLRSQQLSLNERSLVGYALLQRCTVLVEDAVHDERFDEVRVVVHASMFQSAVAIPLIAHEQWLGVLLLFATTTNSLSTSTIRLLELLACQVALALSNAKIANNLRVREVLVEQRHRHLRRAYDLVVAERRTLVAVLDSVSDAVLVIDDQGIVQLGNPAVEVALGIHPDLLIGHPLDQIDVPERLVEFAQRARVNQEGQEGELPLADGRTLHVCITSIVKLDGPIQGYVILLKDVTYFKRLDDMKSQLLATASHDLKSPLNVISGYTELLELVGPLNDEQRQYISKIMRTVRQLTTMIGNVLDLRRIEAETNMTMQPCDLGLIIWTTLENYRLLAQEKRIELVLSSASNLPPVCGNETHLQQVVGNLLANALNYTPAGGTVKLWSEVCDRQVVVRVQDSGIGISPQDMARIFDPFFRTSAAKETNLEGTGLGLTIVKRIIDEHGGSLAVESVVNGGSTFQFTLPLAPSET